MDWQIGWVGKAVRILDGWCCEFKSHWRQFYFLFFKTPRCQYCTEMSDLCCKWKTRLTRKYSRGKCLNKIGLTQDLAWYMFRPGKKFLLRDPPPTPSGITRNCYGYAAGGMPLAFTQEDFLGCVYFYLKSRLKYSKLILVKTSLCKFGYFTTFSVLLFTILVNIPDHWSQSNHLLSTVIGSTDYSSLLPVCFLLLYQSNLLWLFEIFHFIFTVQLYLNFSSLDIQIFVLLLLFLSFLNKIELSKAQDTNKNCITSFFGLHRNRGKSGWWLSSRAKNQLLWTYKVTEWCVWNEALLLGRTYLFTM